MAQEEKVILLLDNFSGHQVPNVGSRLRVTQLVFLPPNTTSRFQQMDAGIIASFKAQYRKLLIQYQIDCITANKVFAINVYQAVIMVEHAWRIGVTTSTIQNCWKHIGIILVLVEREIEETRRVKEVDEIATLLHQLTLSSLDIEESDAMKAHEYLNYELEFDLNNPYEFTDEEFLDMLPFDEQELDVDEVIVDEVEEVIGFGVAERALETL